MIVLSPESLTCLKPLIALGVNYTGEVKSFIDLNAVQYLVCGISAPAAAMVSHTERNHKTS